MLYEFKSDEGFGFGLLGLLVLDCNIWLMLLFDKLGFKDILFW